jgi:four helix bundle protein
MPSFLYIARGSLEEVRYFLFLGQDLGFVTSEIYRDLENNCKEVSLMLNALIKSLKDKL